MGLKSAGASEKTSVFYALREFSRRQLGEENAERVLNAMEGVFQREKVMQEIYVPTIRPFFGRLLDEEAARQNAGLLQKVGNFLNPISLVPTTYKGISFNPRISQYGERFDIIDLFSWAKGVQLREPLFRFYVLDASLYWVVNAAQKSPVDIYSKNAARQATEFFLNGLDTLPYGKEIKSIAETRMRYLSAISALFPNGSVVLMDAKELWENNNLYVNCLQETIDFVAKSMREGEPLEISRYAQYKRYNMDYQRWYTPMVLAEALYLQRKCGVEAKLGPTTETAFDKLIRKQLGASEYDIFWYTRPIDLQMRYEDYVFFNDSPDAVRTKMEKTPALAVWLKDLVQPFYKGPVKDVVEAVVELKQRIQAETECPPTLPYYGPFGIGPW